MKMNKKIAKLFEPLKYCTIGAISTVFNLVLFFIFERLGLHYIAANAISYMLAVLFNYFLNDKLVFKSTTGKRGSIGKFLKFILIRLFNLLADSILFYLCVSVLLLPMGIVRIALTFIEITATYIFRNIFSLSIK